MKRFVMLMSLPRSGSTPVGKTIGTYLKQVGNYEYLSEYFNLHLRGLSEDGRRLVLDESQWMTYDDVQKIPHPMKLWEKENRWKNLLDSEGNYFLKSAPRHLFGIDSEELFKITDMIFLVRRNVFAHLQSHLISMTTGRYYEDGGLNIEEGSVKASREEFDFFVESYLALNDLIERLPQLPCIYYEDFLRLPPEEFLKSIGFAETIDWSQRRLPPRQNPERKRSLFSNYDELERWYRDSELMSFFKI